MSVQRYLMVVAVMATACGTVSTAAPNDSSVWSEAGGQQYEPWDRSGAMRGVEGAFPEWDEAAVVGSRTRARPAGIFDLPYALYTTYLTKMDGPRCEHRPTCSRYGHEAIRKHGFVVGSFLTIDRLMRANRSSVLRRLPIYKIEDGNTYYRDPVESNDFFL